VSLYTSVYWTKRTLVVVFLLVFLCTGFRVFQFVSGKFTKEIDFGSKEPKASQGFGVLDKLIPSHIDTPPGFEPIEFRNNTIKGNFDVDNGYPTQDKKTPVANVYKIEERSYDIDITELPRAIAKKLGFNSEPTSISNTVRTWNENQREFEIDGQYGLVKYKNNILTQFAPSPSSSDEFDDSNKIKLYFQNELKNYGINNDWTNYIFTKQYVNFDQESKRFVTSGNNDLGSYIRLNAIREYPNLSKADTRVTTKSNAAYAYPNYSAEMQSSNNYLIIALTKVTNNTQSIDRLTELSLHNWPINQSTDIKNEDLQTYYIKRPQDAFEELKTTNKFLVSYSEWGTHLPIKPEDLIGIETVNVHRIKLEMYEDTVNTGYIQPVYIFVCQAQKGDTPIELIYMIPALKE
jgi:hypothetical protein